MPRDTQVVRTPNVAAPYNYVVPQNAEILLKTVRAVFDGSGSGGAWLPCVDLISDSGHIITRACDRNVSVAAGGSADVSFRPGRLTGATGGTSLASQIVRAYGFEFSGQTVTHGTTTPAKFDTVATSDATKLSWSTTTNTNDTLTTHGNGWLQLVASCYWPAGTKIDLRISSSNGFDVFPHDGWDSFSGYDPTAIAGNGATLIDMSWYDITSATNVHRVQLTNSDAGNSGPQNCYIGAMFYPGLQL